MAAGIFTNEHDMNYDWVTTKLKPGVDVKAGETAEILTSGDGMVLVSIIAGKVHVYARDLTSGDFVCRGTVEVRPPSP